MARFDSREYRHINLPNRRWEVTWIALRFVSLLPSKETRLVLPHVERMGQHRLVFDPNDLLMNENAAGAHRLLNLKLSLRCVPDVDRGIWLTYGERLSQECFIERAEGFALVLIGVPSLPILVLAVGEILRGMVLCVVG